jgi:chromate transporter
MEQKKKLCIKLFISTFYISALTFGGGYVIVPLFKKKFVNDLKLIDEKEMLDLIAISNASPGALAINASIAIGYRIAKIPGVIAALLGSVLPPFIIILVISTFYRALKDIKIIAYALYGMNAGVCAVILNVIVDLAYPYFKNREVIQILIMILAFILAFFFKVNVILLIITCVVIGTSVYIVRKKVVKNNL